MLIVFTALSVYHKNKDDHMKRILAVLLVSSLLGNASVSASGDVISSSVRRIVDGLGELGGSFGRTEVPLLGQLKDLLPISLTMYCFDKHPNQTMLALAGLFIYVLYNNDTVRSVLRKYTTVEKKAEEVKMIITQQKLIEFEDSFFDFEGDVEFAQERMEELCDEVEQDGFAEQASIHFL